MKKCLPSQKLPHGQFRCAACHNEWFPASKPWCPATIKPVDPGTLPDFTSPPAKARRRKPIKAKTLAQDFAEVDFMATARWGHVILN